MENTIYGKKEKKDLTEGEQKFLSNIAKDVQSDESFVKEMLLQIEDDALFMRVYTRVLVKTIYK
jgi:hypothetical protein